MFSPFTRWTAPTDGPAGGATEGERHAPDSMRSDDEAARALGSPPSTNQGAHNDQSTVQQNRSLRAELSASSPLRLPEGSLQKAAQAAAALAARLLDQGSQESILCKHLTGEVAAVCRFEEYLQASVWASQVPIRVYADRVGKGLNFSLSLSLSASTWLYSSAASSWL